MDNLDNYKQFETVLNLSKKRKFPTIGETSPNAHKSNWDLTDFYFIYDLSKKDIGKYLNTWFVGNVMKNKDGDVYTDEMWTVKKTDKETSDNLYRRKINPISLSIMCPTGARFKKNDEGEIINYQMKAQIHSIDDSSYGIWFDDMKLDELKRIRTKIMEWINAYKEINGEEFLDICISLGANEDSKDYN